MTVGTHHPDLLVDVIVFVFVPTAIEIEFFQKCSLQTALWLSIWIVEIILLDIGSRVIHLIGATFSITMTFSII